MYLTYTTCEQYPEHDHPHYEPCKCGETHRVLVGIPGRVMGGIWVRGASTQRCTNRDCDKLLSYVPHKD